MKKLIKEVVEYCNKDCPYYMEDPFCMGFCRKENKSILQEDIFLKNRIETDINLGGAKLKEVKNVNSLDTNSFLPPQWCPLPPIEETMGVKNSK